MVFNMKGGQFNLAKDNATIYAVQKKGASVDEMDVIIKGIVENLSPLKKEDADSIKDVVDMAREELEKPEPKISRLRSCVTLIAPMITAANGIPILAANLQKFSDYLMTYIHA